MIPYFLTVFHFVYFRYYYYFFCISPLISLQFGEEFKYLNILLPISPEGRTGGRLLINLVLKISSLVHTTKWILICPSLKCSDLFSSFPTAILSVGPIVYLVQK